jgi:hypothetical protein
MFSGPRSCKFPSRVLPADQSKAVELLKKAEQDMLLRFSMRGGAYAPFLFNSRLVKWKGKKHVLLSGKKLYVCWRPAALMHASIAPPFFFLVSRPRRGTPLALSIAMYGHSTIFLGRYFKADGV